MDEHKSYNALNIACSTNYKALKKLWGEYQSWRQAWLAIKSSSQIDSETEWQKSKEYNVRLILNSDPEFPSQLKEIPWAPFGIYIKGAPLTKDEKLVAIVGTRKATTQGKNTAKSFAKILTENGITVVSGLALGLDASAHEGVIEAKGRTIAVLANGLDRVYPRQNENLAKKILEFGGTLISEYPIGSPSLRERFIERNRIVSGLSLGTVIIEAPNESGALATARFALEQNREVFVVPGDIHHTNYVGSHELIKTGAALVTSPVDVLTGLSLENFATHAKLATQKLALQNLDENQKAVINVLNQAGGKITIDEIADLAKLETALVNRSLGFLVIQGMIKEENGKYYV